MDHIRTSFTGPHYAAGPSLIPSRVRQREPDSSPSEIAHLGKLLLDTGFIEYEAHQISRLQYCTVIKLFQRDTAQNLVAPLPLRIAIRRYPEEWFEEQFYQLFQAYLLKCIADLDKVAVPRPRIASQMLVCGYMLLLVQDRASVSTLQRMLHSLCFRGKCMKEPTISERQAFYYGGKMANPGQLKLLPPAAPQKKAKKKRNKKKNKVPERPKIEELNYEAGYDPASCQEADSVDLFLQQRYDAHSNRFYHEDEATDSLTNFQAAG